VSEERRSEPLKGIVSMIAGIGLIAINDALMKLAVTTLPVGEAIFVRGAFALVVMACILPRMGGLTALRWNRPMGPLISAACFTSGLFLFVTSLSLMPLATASVMIFASPLFVTVLAPLILGERVGWWRRIAVLLGFAGAVVVIQPGSDAFTWIVVLPLLAAFADGIREIVTRRVIVHETTISMLFTAMAAVTLVAAATSLLGWRVPTSFELACLAGAGAGLTAGVFLIIEAVRWADASLVSPFKYSGVLWAGLLGFLIWGDVPTVPVIVGAVLIVAGGTIILYRERNVHGTIPKRERH